MLEDKLTYLGLCEGISTATVAWKDLMKPVGFAEIDEFPSAVLKHHYPDVPNFGDITKYKEWKLETDPDLIIGGTPCQSFSVAGLRGGLSDSRGNLTLTFVNILNRFRPKWFIWENVPGVFSSNKGRDFHSFTEGLQAIGYSIGWRVLDAQYFGLAQRRKRVFVVGNNTGDIRGITEVLFEREGLLRDLAQSRQKGKDATKKVRERSTEHDQRKKGVNAFDMQRISEYGNGEKSSTLKRRDYKDHTDLVVDTVSAFSAHMSEPMVHKDKSGTLQAKNPTAVVYQSNQTDARVKDMGNTCQTVIARWGTGGNNQPLVQQSVIRRLTPVECERLQGFPDNYTQIPWKGKAKEDCPDSHRYKALGNAMAVPVIQFLGKNIFDYEKRQKEKTFRR
jgi:DNA (cytosine-5)-methyltransferase 1